MICHYTKDFVCCRKSRTVFSAKRNDSCGCHSGDFSTECFDGPLKSFVQHNFRLVAKEATRLVDIR